MMTHNDTPVLVVEDSDEDFETILEAARASGVAHLIRRAANGDECLETLLGPQSNVVPAIVLLDLNTPGIDGRDTLAAIRASPKLRTLPIVIFSTSFNPKDVAHCYEHGANAYHVKPLRYPEHLALVKELFLYWLHRVILPNTSEAIG